jgi:hypothetical protein
MRQMVGTTAEWAANDLVIGDGELACERTGSGALRLKVGNGVDNFSELDYVGGLVPSFGAGYTWRDVTGARSDTTSYTSPDHPIMVIYNMSFSSAPSGSCVLYVENAPGGSGTPLGVSLAGNAGVGQIGIPVTGIIPPLTDYQFNTTGVFARAWHELRAD